MVTNYIDDGVILGSTHSITKTKYELVKGFEECNEVARKRGMGCSTKKIYWMRVDKAN